MNARAVALWAVAWAAALFAGLGSVAAAEDGADKPPLRVREPAVAGVFYPDDAEKLTRMIDACLKQPGAPVESKGRLRALIAPHAGYVYSGPVAGRAYQLLTGRAYNTVIVLAPSHYAAFEGASVCNADIYRTPLGDVPISPLARELGALKPFSLDPECDVQLPGWWEMSSRRPPPAGEARADTWEHADEVQVPFLQRALGRFALVPVVMGDVDPRRAAQVLQRFVKDDVLLVVSSDLSHYHPESEARMLDTACLEAICKLDISRMRRQEACGRTPILTLMNMAKENGWEPRLVDQRTSADAGGDKDRVVGYGAVAFFEPDGPAYTADDRRYLLELARRALRESVAADGRLPDVSGDGLDPRLTAARGCFVTLTTRRDGELRGCIGNIMPGDPLFRAIMANARNAALDDPRFPAVKPEEVDRLEIEISVLTEPKPLEFSSPEDLLAKLHPDKDGVVLRIGGRGATFLPQVWEQLHDKETFLGHLSIKAGFDRTAWRQPGTQVLIYHVEHFSEAELNERK